VFENKTILVVDDEPDLREITSFEFEYKGATVVTASGGHDALDIVKNQKIDLVISDVRMPEGSGGELLLAMKEQNLLKKTPIILMTGFSDLTRESAIKSGALELFYKPVRWKEVIDLVEAQFS
jgi:DNA-binding NtrC family response regulator